MESGLSYDGSLVDRIKKVPVNINYKTSSGRKKKLLIAINIAQKIERQSLPDNGTWIKLDKHKEQYKRDALHCVELKRLLISLRAATLSL